MHDALEWTGQNEPTYTHATARGAATDSARRIYLAGHNWGDLRGGELAGREGSSDAFMLRLRVE